MDQFMSALEVRDWYAVAALVLFGLVKVWRSAPVTGKLWAAVPTGWRFLPPLVAAASVGFSDAWQQGLPVSAALMQALGSAIWIGLPAMGLHGALKESPIPYEGGAGGVVPLPSRPARRRK